MEQSQEGRPLYTREMGELEEGVLDMASRSESMVTRAVDALQRLDTGLAREVLSDDDEVDILELMLEQKCLRLLALQQPIASDLREIGSVIKIITDIERIGDLAVDIAKICLKLEREMGNANYVDIPLMANVTRQMIRHATQMFVKKEAEQIHEVQKLEDRVDDLYRTIRNQVFDHMIKDPSDVVSAGWLLLAVHHIERIADHALNIAERCYFMVTGSIAPRDEEVV
ncbi:MAG: phosphate signaling complex protein PhoU [Armatimonadetes bacterium]|nr:phosphate signaling complex protein PhoU [Armatimonadota bacterium]